MRRLNIAWVITAIMLGSSVSACKSSSDGAYGGGQPSPATDGTTDKNKTDKNQKTTNGRPGRDDRGQDAVKPLGTDKPIPIDNDPVKIDSGNSTPPPAATTTSNGSGGPKGTGEHKSSATGLRYMINAPADNGAGKAHGLLVLLHGSSASSYDSFVDDMAGVARKYGLIPISVLAPNGSGWNEGNQTEAASLLDQLIEKEIYKQYNVDLTKVFFSGQSSGGGFLGSHFVALYAANFQGGAFLQCGAEPPQGNFQPTAQTIKSFKLHLEITSSDPIWPEYYAEALKVYGQAGMQMTHDDTKPGGHCAFDQAQVIDDHIGPMLK